MESNNPAIYWNHTFDFNWLWSAFVYMVEAKHHRDKKKIMGCSVESNTVGKKLDDGTHIISQHIPDGKSISINKRTHFLSQIYS